MQGFNKVILVGWTGKDPELRYTNSGVAVATFSVAISSSWKNDAGEKQEKTEWVNCVTWKRSAEIMGEYVKKGCLLLVEGRLQTRKYDDKNGITRWVTEVVAEKFTILRGPKDRPEVPAHQEEPEQPVGKSDSDDLPF